MSRGSKSPLFVPIAAAHKPLLAAAFPELGASFVENVFRILTHSLHTELLLAVAVLDMLDRWKKGERETDPAYAKGAGFKLSGITNGGGGKLQTKDLQLLHDVITELPMAGRNYRQLQQYLATQGAVICLQHSCGSAVCNLADEEAFYDACAADQKARTWLDWAGTHDLVTKEQLLREGRYSVKEYANVERVFSLAGIMHGTYTMPAAAAI